MSLLTRQSQIRAYEKQKIIKNNIMNKDRISIEARCSGELQLHSVLWKIINCKEILKIIKSHVTGVMNNIKSNISKSALIELSIIIITKPLKTF